MAFKNDVAFKKMTWHSKNDVADDMAPVWPRRAPRLALRLVTPVWPPRLATPCGPPSGHPRMATPCGPCRAAHFLLDDTYYIQTL
jgi:hypothetical protein